LISLTHSFNQNSFSIRVINLRESDLSIIILLQLNFDALQFVSVSYLYDFKMFVTYYEFITILILKYSLLLFLFKNVNFIFQDRIILLFIEIFNKVYQLHFFKNNLHNFLFDFSLMNINIAISSA